MINDSFHFWEIQLTFKDDLQLLLEQEELQSVGSSFGGSVPATKNSFSVPTIRNWIVGRVATTETDQVLEIIRALLQLSGKRIGTTIL